MKKIILTFFIFVSILFSHPHFFIDSNVTIKKDNISSEWAFDRLNSRVLLFDFDKNNNNLFDEEEKIDFINSHFFKLKKNNYNIFLLTVDDEIKIEPKNINVELRKKRIVLTFDIYANLSEEFTMCTIDEKIYMAYKLNKVNSLNKVEIQKSEYDYCLGVTNE